MIKTKKQKNKVARFLESNKNHICSVLFIHADLLKVRKNPLSSNLRVSVN
jgi:hypothetical protein